MSEPIVSIVIPCFNAQDFIEECIASAIGQSYRQIEVIVVDDGSIDHSGDIVRHSFPQVRIISQQNCGGGVARNVGMTLATGEYIQFLDADDVLLPTAIADKLAAIDDSERIPCSRVRLMPHIEGGKLPRFWTNDRLDDEFLVKFGTPQTSSPLHRKENLVRVGGFRAMLPCAQEYDLHLRLRFLLGLKFKDLNQTGVLIRAHPNSLTRAGKAPLAASKARVLADLVSELILNGDGKKEAIDLCCQALTAVSRRLWAIDQKKAAVYFAQVASAGSKNARKGCYKGPTSRIFSSVLPFGAIERLADFSRRR